MKQVILSALIAALMVGLPATDAEAKRLSSGGMKRSVPTQDAGKPAPSPTAPTQAAPAPQQAAPALPAGQAAAAAAPKRSWMGPIAGLAAGLGIAALASHLGFGGALANVLTMVLLGVVLMVIVGFVMRRFGKPKAQPGLQFAGAGAPYTPAAAQPLAPAGGAAGGAAAGAAAPVNDGFDSAGFEQIAKRVFIRLQAANDAGDQADLRRFTTPEMYGAIQQELLDRKGAAQRTEVLQLDASVIERAEERGEQIVSVRFWGLIREESAAAAAPFDEIWHLVRPVDGSRDWAIAGIQQSH